MGAQDRRVVGERRLDADEIGELLALERGEHRPQPLDPLGMAGRVDVGEAVGVGEERGGHAARLGTDAEGFSNPIAETSGAGRRRPRLIPAAVVDMLAPRLPLPGFVEDDHDDTRNAGARR